MTGLNIESLVSFPRNTFQTGQGGDRGVYCSSKTLLTVIAYSKQFVTIMRTSFKLKMYQARFWLGSRLRRSPNALIGRRGDPPYFPLLRRL